MAKVTKMKMPSDLAAALSKSDGAAAKFKAMPASHQNEWIHVIEDAKKPETRARRIGNAVKAMKTR